MSCITVPPRAGTRREGRTPGDARVQAAGFPDPAPGRHGAGPGAYGPWRDTAGPAVTYLTYAAHGDAGRAHPDPPAGPGDGDGGEPGSPLPQAA